MFYAVPTARVIFTVKTSLDVFSLKVENKINEFSVVYLQCRLGKLACPLVNDDQKIDVGDQKWNSGCPHDYWILESLFYEISCFFFYCFTALQIEYT